MLIKTFTGKNAEVFHEKYFKERAENIDRIEVHSTEIEGVHCIYVFEKEVEKIKKAS